MIRLPLPKFLCFYQSHNAERIELEISNEKCEMDWESCIIGVLTMAGVGSFCVPGGGGCHSKCQTIEYSPAHWILAQQYYSLKCKSNNTNTFRAHCKRTNQLRRNERMS